jgi:hypothetical protein
LISTTLFFAAHQEAIDADDLDRVLLMIPPGTYLGFMPEEDEARALFGPC